MGNSVQKEVCRYNQRGYCKHSAKCVNFHENETFKGEVCKDHMGTKRHPKVCKYFAQRGRCKFNEDCGFAHKESNVIKSLSKLENEMVKMKQDFKAFKSQKDETSGNVQHDSVEMLQNEVKIIRREMEAINNSLNVQYEMLEDM